MSNISELTTLSFPGVNINVLNVNENHKSIQECSGSSVATALATGYFSLFISNCKSKNIDITYNIFNEYLKNNIDKDKILYYNKFIEISNVGEY